MLQFVEAVLDLLLPVGEGHDLADRIGEVHQVEFVLVAEQRIDEVLGSLFFQPLIAEHALAGVDGKDNGERGR